MKKYITYLIAGWAVLAVCTLGACKDELIEVETNVSMQGVDRNHVVDLEIPFVSKKGLDEIIVSRGGNVDMDSQIASLLVLVYEAVDPTKPELNKFIDSYFYETPGENSNGGGWFPNASNSSLGTIKTKCPVGDVYIYLIANWKNSFINFAPGVTINDLKDPAKMPRDQQKFLETFIPTWNGNVYRIDGVVPMIATVDNSTGLCKVSADGTITYYSDSDQSKLKPITIAKDGTTFVDPTGAKTAFDFKRLMAKVTMTIKLGDKIKQNAKFTAKKYTLKNGGKHIAPTPHAWPVGNAFYTKLLEEVQDGYASNFSAQTPNTFTIYVPANLESTDASISNWKERELMQKDEKGKNLIYTKEEEPALAGKFKFKNAPKYASYMEITGEFENPSEDIITAESRFFIHLGNFNAAKGGAMNEFDVKRDHHYVYTITVNGLNDIIVESKGEEQNPGMDGLVYKGGMRAYCDAHFDQVEMKLGRKGFNNDFAVIFSVTPFGSVSLLYYPKGSHLADGTVRTQGECKFINQLVTDKEQAMGYLRWVKMRKQKTPHVFEAYPKPEELGKVTTNIFDALDYAWEHPDDVSYYTCFIDEYYYTEHPDVRKSGQPVHLRDFVNKPDRSIAVGHDIYISKDGYSVCVDAVYVVYQKSIATFYDLNDPTRNKYGVEVISETGKFQDYGLSTWGSSAVKTDEKWDGLANTMAEAQNAYQKCVNWQKNGWLIQTVNGKEVLTDQGKNRLKTQKAYLACMTRNRDLNGNGQLDADEIRWYNPAIHQLLGLWIGQNALPAQAVLYNKPLTADIDNKGGSSSSGAIYSSTYGVDPDAILHTKDGYERVLWSEEGASFGRESQANTYGGEIRAVRNLGSDVPTPTSYKTPADKFYDWNKQERTIEMFLAPSCLRGFSIGELEPHTERSPANSLHKKFQYAKHAHYWRNKRNCAASSKWSEPFNDVAHSKLIDAKSLRNTKATEYTGLDKDNTDPEPWPTGAVRVGGWRLFNQRELAVLYMISPTFYGGQDLKSSTNCTRTSTFGHIHNWSETTYEGIHCRTTFTLNSEVSKSIGIGIQSNYTTCGFWYNIKNKKIECAPADAEAAYFCVRDVQ